MMTKTGCLVGRRPNTSPLPGTILSQALSQLVHLMPTLQHCNFMAFYIVACQDGLLDSSLYICALSPVGTLCMCCIAHSHKAPCVPPLPHAIHHTMVVLGAQQGLTFGVVGLWCGVVWCNVSYMFMMVIVSLVVTPSSSFLRSHPPRQSGLSTGKNSGKARCGACAGWRAAAPAACSHDAACRYTLAVRACMVSTHSHANLYCVTA